MNKRSIKWALGLCLSGVVMAAMSAPQPAQGAVRAEEHIELKTLGNQLEVGDVVFIRIPYRPFTHVADTTQSWTNHVGIVVDISGREPVIAESRFPLSGRATWSRFVARSESGRVAVSRLEKPLDAAQRAGLRRAVDKRSGVLYDTGFNLNSRRQFCSRFVREVLADSAGVQLGQVERFSTLLTRNPQANQEFWRMWYFGYIPWERETVTPASLLNDARLNIIFDGHAAVAHSYKGD